jgi:hypothetical protein
MIAVVGRLIRGRSDGGKEFIERQFQVSGQEGK